MGALVNLVACCGQQKRQPFLPAFCAFQRHRGNLHCLDFRVEFVKVNDKLKLNRQRVAETRQRKREAGLVPKEVWVHPHDWPEIDALIRRLTTARNRDNIAM